MSRIQPLTNRSCCWGSVVTHKVKLPLGMIASQMNTALLLTQLLADAPGKSVEDDSTYTGILDGVPALTLV